MPNVPLRTKTELKPMTTGNAGGAGPVMPVVAVVDRWTLGFLGVSRVPGGVGLPRVLPPRCHAAGLRDW